MEDMLSPFVAFICNIMLGERDHMCFGKSFFQSIESHSDASAAVFNHPASCKRNNLMIESIILRSRDAFQKYDLFFIIQFQCLLRKGKHCFLNFVIRI